LHLHDQLARYDLEDLTYILAGDEYERLVYKVQVGEFWENRTAIGIHDVHYPQCPFLDYDPFDESRGSDVKEISKRPVMKSFGLHKAA